MKFSKVIGNIDDKLVAKAEDKLSQVFIELGMRYDNDYIGTKMGGDPLIFSLIYPIEHICTSNISTAATDGKRYFWSPKFVLKKSKIGLRIVCSHEAWHAIYMHPQRRGSRNPKLWNIAVDYIVNNTCMQDLKARKLDADSVFTKEVGRYMPLLTLIEFIKDPFNPPKGWEDIKITRDQSGIDLPDFKENRDLTAEEQKELERREKAVQYYYADPDLEDDMKRPEKIYDVLYNLLPKCPKCGSIGRYSKKDNKGKDKGKDKDKDKNKGDGDGDDEQNQCPGCGKKSCPECGGEYDIFGLGATLDSHTDTEESEEKLAQRISEAMEAAKRMAGVVPASLEDELGQLTAPKITWQDIIRTRLLKSRSGNGRNDWTRFQTRPMFAGLLVPKRKNYYSHFGCLLDTSGSMSKDDMAFGLSQLCSLDERNECTLTCADAEVYFDKSVKLKKCNAEEITNRVKIIGRGGTCFSNYFTEYEKHIGTCDFLVIITDGYLLESDTNKANDPGIDVFWLITSNCDFKPPFGRVLSLHQ